MQKFARIYRLPPYVFAIVDELKCRRGGPVKTSSILAWAIRDNPPPQPIIDKLCEAAKNPRNHRY